jgi:hypothetical protein
VTEIKKGACTVCPRQDVSVTATGGLRVHAANGKKTSPDNPACPGSGQEPKGTVQAGDVHFLCRVPAGPGGCGKEVQLTSNHRARSHLNGPGYPCPGGSDWVIAVLGSDRLDTSVWTEDEWKAALPKREILPAARPEDLKIEEETDFDPRPVRDVPLSFSQGPDGSLREMLPGGLPGPKATMGLAHDEAGLFRPDPHRYEADAAIAAVESDRLRSEAAYEESVRDGLAESRKKIQDQCQHDFTGTDTPGEVSACRMCGLIESDTLPNDPRDDEDRRAAFARPEDDQALFEPTHVYDDGAGGTWTHPGPKADCRLVECDNDWHTPPDLLAQMPEDVQALARSAPLCWDCGHKVTPLVERFEIDGSVEHVIWACEHGGNCDCAAKAGGCRVKGPAQAFLSDLVVGEFFVRHTAKWPLANLVYRVAEHESVSSVRATVVSAGPLGGREGTLTNLTEEVTCTDLNGKPRPRRDPRPDRGTGSTSPSSPARPSLQPTPSAPRTAPNPSRAPGSTPTTRATARPATSTTSKRATSSGPTGTAGTSPRSAVPDAFSTPKEAVRESDKYDSYGRYKLLHPDSSKKVNWTRATTFCKSIQDTYALSMWSQRMVLKGASLRPDLTAAAGTLEVKADKDRMNGLVDEAKKAAGDKIAANKGTAVHAYTEDLDKELVGMPVEPKTVPGEFIPTVQAYKEILSGFGLEPVPGLIEFTTAVRQYEVAGTADRVYRVTRDITIKLNGRPVTLYAGEYVIGDVKTGADLSYGWQEIAIQLALYAQGLNTSGVWDWGTRIWSRPEDGSGHQIQVRTDVGIVPHLPVDRSETRAPLATLYAVDLTAGWAAAVLCGQVRSWRKERTLATPLEIADVAGDRTVSVRVRSDETASAPVSRSVPASRPVTLKDEAQAVTSRAEASAVYQKAVAARMPKKKVGELVQIMSDKLKSFTEQGA